MFEGLKRKTVLKDEDDQESVSVYDVEMRAERRGNLC